MRPHLLAPFYNEAAIWRWQLRLNSVAVPWHQRRSTVHPLALFHSTNLEVQRVEFALRYLCMFTLSNLKTPPRLPPRADPHPALLQATHADPPPLRDVNPSGHTARQSHENKNNIPVVAIRRRASLCAAVPECRLEHTTATPLRTIDLPDDELHLEAESCALEMACSVALYFGKAKSAAILQFQRRSKLAHHTTVPPRYHGIPLGRSYRCKADGLERCAGSHT